MYIDPCIISELSLSLFLEAKSLAIRAPNEKPTKCILLKFNSFINFSNCFEKSSRFTLDSDGDGVFVGTVSDSKGNLRSIPRNNQTSAYTLVAADAGKCVTAGGNVTINNSIFASGDAISIINHSGSDITLTQGSSTTIYNTADATTGNRTLASRGMATILFTNHDEAYISGAGLS